MCVKEISFALHQPEICLCADINERSIKKYEYYAYDDINHEGFAKGTRKVLVD